MERIRDFNDFVAAVDFIFSTTARERRIFSEMVKFDGNEIVFGTVKDYEYPGGFLIDNIGNNLLVVSDALLFRLKRLHPHNEFTRIVGKADININPKKS